MIVPGKNCKLREKFVLAALRLSQALLGSTIFLSTLHMEAIYLTTNSSATTARNFSRRSYLSSTTKKAGSQCPKCGSKERRAALVCLYRHHVEKERVNELGVTYAVREVLDSVRSG